MLAVTVQPVAGKYLRGSVSIRCAMKPGNFWRPERATESLSRAPFSISLGIARWPKGLTGTILKGGYVPLRLWLGEGVLDMLGSSTLRAAR